MDVTLPDDLPPRDATRRRTLALLLVAALALGSLGLALASAHGGPLDDAQRFARHLSPLDRAHRDRGHGSSPGAFAYDASSGNVTGTYLSFRYAAAEGRLEDVRAHYAFRGGVRDVPLFDAVAARGFDAANATASAEGPNFTADGGPVRFHARDLRRAPVGVASEEGPRTVAFDLADECRSRLTERGVAVLCGRVRATIHVRGDVQRLERTDDGRVVVAFYGPGAVHAALDAPQRHHDGPHDGPPRGPDVPTRRDEPPPTPPMPRPPPRP